MSVNIVDLQKIIISSESFQKQDLFFFLLFIEFALSQPVLQTNFTIRDRHSHQEAKRIYKYK